MQIQIIIISVTDPATVIGFFATLKPNETTIIFSKDDSLELLCTVDSYPNATINISRSDIVLKHRTNSSQMIYEIKRAKCSDSGTYVCIAHNEKYESGNFNSKRLHIFVTCKYKFL